jgi:hypothetical protein
MLSTHDKHAFLVQAVHYAITTHDMGLWVRGGNSEDLEPQAQDYCSKLVFIGKRSSIDKDWLEEGLRQCIV